jgi:spermidine synthase
MLDQRGRPHTTRRLSATLPVPPRAARALVLTAVFVCAACGLVYELELVALASYLVGDSVTQASVVLSVMVFAMGCGSLLAKRLRDRAAAAFAAVESALALVGGLSVMVLYAVFAWYGQARFAMIGCAFAIGVLIGAEVPLLMTLVQRIRRQDAGGAVADLFAADYVGALVGGLAFPFLLLPYLGQLTGALVTGGVNAVAGSTTVLWLFRGDLSRRARVLLLTASVGVLAVLACAAVGAGPFERAARQAVYGGRVRVAEQTGAEEIVLTGSAGAGGGSSLRLYLDGRLAVCGADEARYHQALVDPAMAGPRARVLVLGGGDGLALREVLRYPDVRSVTVVPGDAAVARLGRGDPGLTDLNDRAFSDPRVRTMAGDAFDWLRSPGAPGSVRRRYDVIIADLPDPGDSRSAKLYSEEFYGLAERALGGGGRLAVHAGSSAHTLWTTDATLRAAGLRTTPYAMDGGRACGKTEDWNLLLAAPAPPRPTATRLTVPRPAAPRSALSRDAPPPRLTLARDSPPRLTVPRDAPAPLAVSAPSLRTAAAAALRTRPRHPLPPSTLLHPRVTE